MHPFPVFNLCCSMFAPHLLLQWHSPGSQCQTLLPHLRFVPFAHSCRPSSTISAQIREKGLAVPWCLKCKSQSWSSSSQQQCCAVSDPQALVLPMYHRVSLISHWGGGGVQDQSFLNYLISPPFYFRSTWTTVCKEFSLNVHDTSCPECL